MSNSGLVLPNKKILFAVILIVFIAINCTPRKKMNTAEVKEEIKEREPRKINDSDILQRAQEIGAEVSSNTQQALSAKLQTAIKVGGIKKAIQYCNLNAYPTVDSVQQLYHATIKRVTNQPRNPNDVPDKIEEELLVAYQAAKNNGLPPEDNVQILDNEYVLFSRPIFINNTLCLSCHGVIGKDIDAETQALIQQYYPGDKATGYQFGDLRGMWSIKLHKKEIIQSMF